ncbi:DNA replication and repair protein RecF [Candidatus Saccharibacteria bacterium]|nr:DNA replication and repair protein RecF [Candidatus Saccharibacteria bacterium]
MENIIIKSVKLENFRSHESYFLDSENNTTLILGENGCGKTSVLEAIYIAMQGKSFRAVDKEIVKRGAEYYRVELNLKNSEKIVAFYEMNKNKKTYLIEDKRFMRLPRTYKYPVVLFLPEDLHLVATSPTKRREYFDRLISQINDGYGVILNKYNKILKQRNELLKRDVVSLDDVFSWDILLAKYGVEIRKYREMVASEIGLRISEVYRDIANNDDEPELLYDSYTGEVGESEFLKLLQMDFERDKLMGHTNFGVHKDDFRFIFNHSLADGSASRGETRSMILALKFIEAEILEEKLRKKPIVLLDDVFSELDKNRQASLVKNFSQNQVILTSVSGVD